MASNHPTTTPKSTKSVRFKDNPPSILTSTIGKLSIFHLLALGAVVRFILIVYGVYHDSKHTLKYTDVDYYVFSDAASYILHPQLLAPGPLAGYIADKWKIYIGNPYDRATYRYTPLLAILLLPNVNLHPLFGKFLFSAADLGIALIQYRLLTLNKPGVTKKEESTAKILVTSIWLLNPFVANISTRGSAESLLGFMVLSFLYLLGQSRLNAAAVVFGLAVHFKIYPVIYASSVLAYLSTRNATFSFDQIKFAVISFATFMLLNLTMYSVWGMPFIEHTYLYHLTRLDHRHNFSQYFYQIYLASASSSSSRPVFNNTVVEALYRITTSTFIPQLALSLGFGFCLATSLESLRTSSKLHRSNLTVSSSNLAAVFFIQTITFTTFNRVCTSQYFMWYLWLLPLVLSALNLSSKRGLAVLVAWIGGQAAWLSMAYRLEFLGEAVFKELWMAGVGFFIVNVGVVWILIGQLES